MVGSAVDRPRPEGVNFYIDTGPDGKERSAFEKWLLLALFRNFSRKIRVCTPNGVLLKLDSWFFIPFIPDAGVVIGAYERNFPEAYSIRLDLSEVDFENIDIEYGRVKVDSSEPEPEYLSLKGMPLCIAKSDLPVSVNNLTRWLLSRGMDIFHADEADLDQSETIAKNKGGRPTLHEVIVTEFKGAYPRGLQGEPLVQIAEKLGYDRKTVRKALENAGLYRR